MVHCQLVVNFYGFLNHWRFYPGYQWYKEYCRDIVLAAWNDLPTKISRLEADSNKREKNLLNTNTF